MQADNSKINIAHSLIDSYPPNINKFPKFYNAGQQLFVLEPGDMLYIPPKWFHWVHSYQTDGENIAVSFPALEYEPPILNEFSTGAPFIYSLNKDSYAPLNLTAKDFENISESTKHKMLISKSNILVPVDKGRGIPVKVSSIDEAKKFVSDGYYSALGQNFEIAGKLKIPPPYFLLSSFPKCRFYGCAWLYMYPDISKRKDTFIDTGLHFDYGPNVLIQVKGKKVIRLFSPEDSHNLYLSPMQMG